MTNSEKLAFRILASLYPDRRPSEIRKIIDEALQKTENQDDISLWITLCKETPETKEEPVKEKVIERHYYHSTPWYYTYNTYTSPSITSCRSAVNSVTIDCLDSNTYTDSASVIL